MQNGSFPGCPIQRFLILHLNLARLSTGKDLGEGASQEEWSQEILFYHSELHHHHQEQQEEQPSSFAAAVQFAGLCSALYQLPNSVKSDKHNNNPSNLDLTHEVQFDQSTLVFVPLETIADKKAKKTHCNNSNTKSPPDEKQNNPEPNIVAVVQLSRRTPNEASGGNPLAIRLSIQKWHDVFCLLRGGGIHERLLNARDDPKLWNQYKKKNNKPCVYPGMDQLYDGRKTLRKLQETIHRSREPDPDLEKERHHLERELQDWEQLLPITSLRKDLQFHYNAYLGDFALIAGRNGGVGRCLVENVPAPVAVSSGKHAWEWSPSNPPPHVSIHLGHTIRSLFEEPTTINDSSDRRPQLSAISTFYHGQLLYHHDDRASRYSSRDVDDDNPEERIREPNGSEIYNASDPLLMWYLSSYSFKMKQQRQTQETFEASTPPRRISRGLVSFSDHASATGGVMRDTPEDNGTRKDPTSNDIIYPGMFLNTPPLAMLSASEQQMVEVRMSTDERVWAPLVHLPRSCNDRTEEESTSDDDGVIRHQAHVVLYEWKDFSFLLYVSPAMTNAVQSTVESAASLEEHNKVEEKFAELLCHVSSVLSDALNLLMLSEATKKRTISPSLSVESYDSLSDSLSAPGQDVIFMDRSTYQMMLFPRAPKLKSLKYSSASKKGSKGFLGVFSPIPSRPIPRQSEAVQNIYASTYSASDLVANGMDCRHLLASHLPLDTILAFDDAMNEVHRRRQKVLKQPEARYESQSSKITPRNLNASSSDITVDCAFEQFTSIPQGWLYVYADSQDREVYVFLDSDVYVTVADIQKAAKLVRSRLFHDMKMSETSVESSPANNKA